MKRTLNKLERRIRKTAAMNIKGLAGTLASLLIFHPLSFIGFIIVGIALMLFANVYFLYALIRGPGKERAIEQAATQEVITMQPEEGGKTEPEIKPELTPEYVLAP